MTDENIPIRIGEIEKQSGDASIQLFTVLAALKLQKV